MASEPVSTLTSSSVPRRATGEIPLSWAVPAEAVSAAPPPSSSPVSLVTVVAALAVVALIGFAITQWSKPARSVDGPTHDTGLAPSSLSSPPPKAAPAAVDAVVGLPTPPPPSVQPVAVAEAPVVAPAAAPVVDAPATPASKARARGLVARARRLAKDGDVPGARALAEDAVVADPACGECWKTVALLRKKTGDRVGAGAAKARAHALDDGSP